MVYFLQSSFGKVNSSSPCAYSNWELIPGILIGVIMPGQYMAPTYYKIIKFHKKFKNLQKITKIS